ncbi:MAG TPA: hypothetical protein PKA58_24605, partial [Polyangium sp.]|nr:hypothetical protein [Polyangium sp.]
MSRWKRLASERFVATTLVLFASSIGGMAGCELIATIDRTALGETGGGGNGGMGGMGGTAGAGGATCTPVDDMNDCTTDECVDGKPVNTPLAVGTMCGADKDMFCDDKATCVVCLTASDCPGVDDECQTRTCTMGACGFDYTPKDTPLNVQMAGDCKLKVCDGMGAQIDNNDDADVPDDNNACTDNVCSA